MSTPPRTPEEIKADIESTREELADTAAALAYKADIKSRAKERVAEIKSTITDPETAKGAPAKVSQSVEAHPIPAAAIAAALFGFALGYLLARGD